MACHPIELPPFWWRTLSGLLAKSTKNAIGDSTLQNGQEGCRCLCCCDWYQSIKREVWITCWQQGVSSAQAITQIVRARSSVPERNKVRLRSFHTSLIENYENRKDSSATWTYREVLALQSFCKEIYIYIYQCFQKVREGRCNINEMWLNPSKGLFLSFCEYHTVCVETSVGSQRPFSWAFCEYHSGCGWVNVYVWERLFGPKGSLLLERQSHLGSFPDRRSMLLKGRFPWIHFTVKERTTLLNQYSLFCSIKKKVHAIQR